MGYSTMKTNGALAAHRTKRRLGLNPDVFIYGAAVEPRQLRQWFGPTEAPEMDKWALVGSDEWGLIGLTWHSTLESWSPRYSNVIRLNILFTLTQWVSNERRDDSTKIQLWARALKLWGHEQRVLMATHSEFPTRLWRTIYLSRTSYVQRRLSTRAAEPWVAWVSNVSQPGSRFAPILTAYQETSRYAIRTRKKSGISPSLCGVFMVSICECGQSSRTPTCTYINMTNARNERGLVM